MLVGPTAIGKSTVMNEVVTINADFSRVTGFTTRAPRSNDEPGHYRYLSVDDVKQIEARGDVVQSAINAGTGDIYGTELVDYSGRYCLKDTLSSAVSDFTKLPFKSHITISLTANPDDWLNWVLDRYPEPSLERTKRLKEAKQSIEWSLAQPSMLWLVNRPAGVNDSAQSLIQLVKQPQQVEVPREPAKMLTIIQNLL